MAVTTVYASGAGRFQRLDATATDVPNSRVDAAAASETINSGGAYSTGKWQRGFWHWLGRSFPTDPVSSATLTVQCPSTAAPHSHPVSALGDDPRDYTTTSLPPHGNSLGEISQNTEQTFDVTDVVSAWCIDPTAAYGFILDVSGTPSDGHTGIRGYDVARVTITASSNLVPTEPTNVDTTADPVLLGSNATVTWTYSDPEGDPQTHSQIRWRKL